MHLYAYEICSLMLLLICSDMRWTQVDQDVSHTNLVPFLQKFVSTAVVCYVNVLWFSACILLCQHQQLCMTACSVL